MTTHPPGSEAPRPASTLVDRASGKDAPPYVPYWHPGPTLPTGCASILKWSAATDVNAPFNRSVVALRPRAKDQAPELRANSRARAGEGRVMSCAQFWGTGQNWPQGVSDHRYYAFSHWQYLDVLVFWAGVADAGLICPPNGHVTDAAHRNGVKVYGSVFFPPTGDGGNKAWVEDFVRTKTVNGTVTYPVTDKLIEAARYFGFDGWFINYETPTDAVTEAGLRAALAYARAKSTVEFTWYEGGRRELTGAGDRRNDFYLQDGSKRVCDSVFIDYGWDNAAITRSIATAKKITRDPLDVYYGLELVRDVPENPALARLVCPVGASHRGSLALYAAHTVSNQPKEPKDAWLGHFYRAEADFWTGPCHNPSDTGWPGIAAHIGERTTITSLPFVTHFNAGHGTAYHHAGAKVSQGGAGWANLSLQDILPTYRWITCCTGNSRLAASLAFDDAWEGGSCLRLTGALAPRYEACVRLYQTQLALATDTQLTVRAQTPSDAKFSFCALIALGGEPTDLVPVKLSTTDTSGWKTYTADLSAYSGKNLVQLGLKLHLDRSAPTDLAYDIKVGQMALHNGTFTAPPPPTGLTIDHATATGSDRKALRLRWTPPAETGAIRHYALHRGTGTAAHLGATPNTVYYLDRLDKGSDTTTTLTVTSVGLDGTHSTTGATTTLTW
ncbi:endo-beta-N-acetylglucosaminidase [Streptomyces paromomycinus]|uniref:Endo-beta-N-acetylglucosaminidase n=1 Tax=Streptomyces paromomycinus TaxID=92743 RepID=A0A401VYX4_STREY|nr:glycoside hydrolase [Streptomyces paromomycinus]GCD42267.1 endo-beta-N-acetylglucosaminidase [Streptomyces paromomycinus]